MRVIVCLAVFLVASLSTGEALKCRMCTSEKDTDLCTKNPWIIGVQECGKPGMNMGETLEEIKKQLENKTSTELPDFAKLAGFMETLMVKKPTVGEYIWKVNTTKTDDSKIVSLMKAYGSYAKSATQNEYVTLEDIDKFNDFGNNEKLGTEVKAEIDAAIEEIGGINTINKGDYGTLTDYTEFKTAVYRLKTDIAEKSVTEMTKLESRKQTVLNKTTEWSNLLGIPVPAIKAVAAAVKALGDKTAEDLKTVVSKISFPTNPPSGQSLTELLTNTRIFLDNYFNHVDFVSTYSNALKTLVDEYFKDFRSFEEAEKKKIVEKLSTNLNELKSAVTAAIAELPKAPVNATWTCFKETNDKKIVTKRGCMEKVDKLADGVLVCDDKDGCNSSSIITIGGLPIFLAIAVALGFAR